MARYISEDEFVAWVKEHYCAECNNYNGLRCRACWIDDAIDLVEDAPTADVAPKREVAMEIIADFKEMAKKHLLECGLYLAVFKNTLDYVEEELKKKYTEGKE